MTLQLISLRIFGAILYPVVYLSWFGAMLALSFLPFFLLIWAGLHQIGPVGFVVGLAITYIALGLMFHKPLLAFIGYCLDLQGKILRTCHLV